MIILREKERQDLSENEMKTQGLRGEYRKRAPPKEEHESPESPKTERLKDVTKRKDP